MTEEEWMTSQNPDSMLKFLRGRERSNRKLRLFACACYRRIWPLIHDDRGRKAVEVAEQFADGLTSYAELDAAYTAAHRASAAGSNAAYPSAAYAAEYSVHVTASIKAAGAGYPGYLAALSQLLRHIIGDPFHPPP